MNSLKHGSRIIKLDGNKRTFDSYIRNEDGLIERYDSPHKLDTSQLICELYLNDTLIS